MAVVRFPAIESLHIGNHFNYSFWPLSNGSIYNPSSRLGAVSNEACNLGVIFDSEMAFDAGVQSWFV